MQVGVAALQLRRHGWSLLVNCRLLCRSAERPTFSSSILPDSGAIRVFVPNAQHPSDGEELLVCWKLWNMAAANVVCRERGHPL